MKKLLLTAASLFAFGAASAQTLDKGDAQLNAGFGFSGWGTPVYLGVDFGVSEVITLGLEGSYRDYKTGGFGGSIIGIQANGNYHFGEAVGAGDKWDLYGGLSANYYTWGGDYKNNNFVDTTSFGIGAQLGVRYFFTDSFGINLEGGGGNATSGGKLGVTFKL